MAKDIRLSNTRMKNVGIELTYNPTGEATAEIFMVYDLIAEDGTSIPAKNKTLKWVDLPSNVQNQLDGFLKHLDREFRSEQINENDSNLVLK